ncbi:DUF2218 domain-containing protein [Streptomyces sp. NPDC051554]|uniref:DUF2218 domain-containing protein n=1 Tax=Streptomyces sp. NPDC051554 TaxID=3365656 RepID=UPI00379320D3
MGECTLQATPGTLTARVEAADQENLGQLQDLVTTHMGRFSRREPLSAEWQPFETSVDESGETERPAPPRQRRGGRARVMVVGAAVVAVALHLALGGSVLADTPWTGWAVGFVVTAVLVKVTAVGGLAIRRGRPRTG